MIRSILFVIALAGCAPLYPVPENPVPMVKDPKPNLAAVNEACGERGYRLVVDTRGANRWVKETVLACAFVEEEPCRIVYVKGQYWLTQSHEEAHCNGTYSHEPITWRELKKRIAGN